MEGGPVSKTFTMTVRVENNPDNASLALIRAALDGLDLIVDAGYHEVEVTLWDPEELEDS